MELDTPCEISRWILDVISIRVLFLSLLVVSVASVSPPGFISLDCGGSQGLDETTSLDWTTCEEYLEAATELARDGVTMKANVTLASTSTLRDNAERLKTALIFYPANEERISRSKFCFKLPVDYKVSEASRSYLLRATFPSRNLSTTTTDLNGNQIFLSAYSTRFYLTIDSTFVSTIDLTDNETIKVELIISAFDTKIYVCLVPLEDRSSMPAISALELRPFALGMYRRGFDVVREGTGVPVQTSYLTTIVRSNFGGDPSAPSLRYPEDPYDRLWSAFPIRDDVKAVRNVTVVSWNNSAQILDVDPPVAVMSTAWEGTSLNSNITISTPLVSPGAQQPSNYYYSFLFLDKFSLGNQSRFVDMLYDQGDGFLDAFRDIIVPRDNINQLSSKTMTFEGDSVTATVLVNGSSELPVLINSLELYGEFNAVRRRTVEADDQTVRNFSLQFPNQLDEAGDPCLPTPWAWLVCSIELPPRVTQINLTSKGFKGSFPVDFGELSRLTVLDLSNNSFSGTLPKTVENIYALRALKLERNDLAGPLPTFASRSLSNLETLSFHSNRLNGSLFSLFEALDDTISSLNLSNNSFNGTLPARIEKFKNLQLLDTSHNNLSGELPVDLMNIPRLRVLNLQYNKFNGSVPDIDWPVSALESVNLEGNKFTQVNLTNWYRKIKEGHVFGPDYRGLRLTGNPIENVRTESLVRQARGNEVSHTALIIIGVVSGFFVLIILCAFIFFLRRMQSWTRELHQIQNALAKENVKPPFYKYDDLRTATNSFSEEQILGKGGFGTVYRAELQDGNVVAVKRLNPTEQNTSDFLNEVVNISGIKHRNLIQLKGCCVREKQQRMLVYEYAENKNLAEALWGKEKALLLNWQQRFNICLGIARGLAYLNEELHPKMVHRDIKPQNILLDKEYNPKIADFGLVRPTVAENTEVTSHIGGTRGYCAPEYLSEGLVSEKVDVYSFGIVLLEIVSGRACIDMKLSEDKISLRTLAMRSLEAGMLLDLVDSKLGENYDKDQVMLVLHTGLACCQWDSKKRPTMSQVVNRLMRDPDVAIDIIQELRGFRSDLESTLDSETITPRNYFLSDSERHGLMSMSSSPFSLTTDSPNQEQQSEAR